MQLASSPAFPEPLPVAMPQLREKPRLGVRSWNPALYPGHEVCNSTAAIGLQFRCSEIVSGPVVAPNNGTPAQPQQPDVYDKCNAEGKAASAQEPSMLPNQSSLLTGVMGYVVTIARTGSQKAGWQGFLIGNLLRPLANAYLQSAAYTNTRQACLAANGAGSLTFTMAP